MHKVQGLSFGVSLVKMSSIINKDAFVKGCHRPEGATFLDVVPKRELFSGNCQGTVV